MKIKERALSLLLSLVMVLTFMPALAFAEAEEGADVDGAPSVEESLDVEKTVNEEPGTEEAVENDKKESIPSDILVFDVPDNETVSSERLNAGQISVDRPHDVTYSGNPTVFYGADAFRYVDEVDAEFGRYYEFRPAVGDTITLDYGESDLRDYVYTVNEEGYGYFEYYDEENDDYDWIDIDEDYNQEKFSVTHIHWEEGSEEPINDWSFQIDYPAYTFVDAISGIAFEPASITLEASNISYEENGKTVYDLDNRGKSVVGEWSPFLPGDRLTVRFANGTTKVFSFKQITFKYYDYDDEQVRESTDYIFVSDDKVIFRPYIDYDYYLNLGANTVAFNWDGYTALVNVFVDSPEQRAARAAATAEAARQGTYDPSLPKVKASKPKAAKKAFTAKWKKLKKKQLKSGVSNIEVWACADGAFANGSTIERVAGKKKASLKLKGMQKGVTYFVKVRAIKYVGGVKYVGPWSAVKKVKVKK